MPNYVTSKCRIKGPESDVARFRAEIIRTAPEGHSDAGGPLFDFEAVIPMPASLKEAEESSHAEMGATLIIARGSNPPPFSKLGLYDADVQRIRAEAELDDEAGIDEVAAAYLAKNPDIERKGLARLSAIVETGFASWYPWAIAKWGTKWGAFRFRLLAEEPFAFQFETAWSFPTPIFEALAARYPTLGFECMTYDEGSCFAGEGWFNPPVYAKPFTIGPATDDLYERVYGHPPEQDEE